MTYLREREPRALVIDGAVVRVRVRESPRARRSRIVVRAKQPLEIVVPRKVGDAEVDRMLDAHRRWIRAKIARASEIASRTPQLGLDRAGVVWLDLRPIPVATIEAPPFHTGPVRAALRDGHLAVGPVSARGSDDAAALAIDRWYRRHARVLLTEAVVRNAGRLGLRYRSIAIRDQRTRWGSCSRRGTLSFNWRLAIAPHDVREYVVVHELLHLRELNHSKAFWRLVDDAMPEWPERSRWLDDHGNELHAFAPTLPDC